jgi:hypothetical protein
MTAMAMKTEISVFEKINQWILVNSGAVTKAFDLGKCIAVW